MVGGIMRLILLLLLSVAFVSFANYTNPAEFNVLVWESKIREGKAAEGRFPIHMKEGDLHVTSKDLMMGGICLHGCDEGPWPPGKDNVSVVPYEIGPKYTTEEKELIYWAMRVLEGGLSVRFVPRANESAYIYIEDTHDGCWTTIGRHGAKQTVSLQRWQSGQTCLLRGTVLHELIHVLNIGHEHQRPDRQSYLNVEEQNVILYLRSQLQLDERLDSGKYSAFDFASVMLYASKTFSGNGLPVLVPKNPKYFRALDAEKVTLSSCDWHELMTLYPAPNKRAPSPCVPHELPRVCRPTKGCLALNTVEFCRNECTVRCISGEGEGRCEVHPKGQEWSWKEFTEAEANAAATLQSNVCAAVLFCFFSQSVRAH